MANYLRLLKFIKGHWNLFFISVFIMFVAGFFEIFSFSLMAPITDIVFTQKKVVVPNELPQFVANYIDYLNNAEPRWLMPRIFGAFFFLMVFKNFLIFGYQYLMGDMTQRVMRDVRYRLYERIQTLSLDYFSEKRTGELLSRITHDSNLLENAVSYGLTDLFRQTFIIIFWIITAFTIDPKAALIIFGIFPFIGLPMSLIGKRLRKISIGIQETMADINSLLLETISGVKLVKAFNTEQYEIQRFKGQNHGYYKLKLKAMKSLILISPLTEVIGAVVSIILVFWFGDRILDGELSFGVFALFMASIMSIISPVKKLGNVNALIQQALAANDRIYDVLDTKPSVEESPTAKEAAELKDNIRLENVEFHYREDSGVVLHDINLEIKKGDLVAIVGPTGTGKSTLVNLLPRFYDATKGKVLFDGMNVRDLSFQSLRMQFGIVTQESILFNDTVKSNIAYGHNQATQEEIESAAKKAYAHRFIVKMPKGYDTVIGDRGFRLSGGEKQRISIARAILKNPPILILDEATSQLDSESEKFVQEALDELMEGRTVVAIAHRLSTVMKADKIVVIDGGRIVGIGRHAELLKTCPLYEKLHSMQFQA